MSDQERWGPPGATPGPGQPSNAPPPPGAATEVVPSDAPSPRRSRGKVAVGVVGVVALVGAGVFAVSRLSGDEAGGAETPEEAVELLFTAVDAEDVLGAIDVLLPAERDTLREPAEQFFDEMRRLDVLSEDADPTSVGGVDVRLEIGEMDVETTNVEDIANVTVTGTASATVDGEELPIGELILDNVDGDPSELDTRTSSEEFTVPVTVVEDDGRWYVSAFYAVAEQARQSVADLSFDDDEIESEEMLIPEEGVTPVGGDSPEDAMDNMVQAVEELDVEAIIAALNPDEWGALQRYAPLFLDDAQQSIDESGEVSISIDDPVYEVSGSGDTRSISISELHGELTVDGETATVDYADGCWVVAADGDSIDSCQIGEEMPELDDMFDDPEPVQDFLDAASAAFEDYENPGLIVEDVDGQWYLSPIATMSDQFFALTGALEREEVDQLIETGEGATESIFDEVFNFDLSVGDDDFATDEDTGGVADTLPPEPATVPTFETLPPVTVPGETIPLPSVEGAAGDLCYTETDAQEAADCFGRLIESGDLDPVGVEVYMRHPECGLAEAFWAGEYYRLPDAEFMALVEQAAPCFQQLVQDGELTAGDLPYELSHPECLEGRNWYLALADDEDNTYFERLTACAVD